MRRGTIGAVRHPALRTCAPVLAMAVLAAALSACAGIGEFPDQIGAAYRSVDEARNQAMVMNILRASKHRPLAFATVTNVTGQGSLTGGFGIVTPPYSFTTGGGVTTQSANEPLSGQVSNTVGYNVAVLDSQEFYVGLLTPLTIATINFALEQGFPRDILLNLFIDHVEERSPQGVVVSVNDPDDPSFPRFQNSLRSLMSQGLTTRRANEIEDAGPPIPAEQLYDARRVAAIAQAGALVRPVAGGRYQIFVRRRTAAFCFDPALATRPIEDPELRKLTCDAKSGATVVSAGQDSSIALVGAHGETRIVTRSVRGIFDYLGALVGQPPDRQVYVAAADPARARAGIRERLIDIETDRPAGGSWLTTSFEGETYHIPREGGDTTTRVIGAVTELLALNTSTKALPLNNTVTIFGQGH